MMLRSIDHNLPMARAALIGRGRELAELGRLFGESGARLVTIVGPGGVGKTRLATEYATRQVQSGAGEVAFVHLAELREPDLAASAIRAAITLDSNETHSDRAFFASLQNRAILIVLDNLEQVVAAAPFIASLLDAGPALRLLATSRSPLRISGEQEYPLAPFSIENDDASSDAVALFLQRAKAVDPYFAITPENIGDIAAICRRLDGLPLAIELAAARSKILSPAAMRARLDQTPLNPGPGRRDAPERQQTLAKAIDWSFRLLSDDEQRLFRTLSVYAGSFTIESAEAVWRSIYGADDAFELVDGIAQLTDNSLIFRVIAPAGERFAMLQTIRAFALEQLAASAQADRVRDRHARFFTEYLAKQEKPGAGGVTIEGAGRVRAEIDNLRAALIWSWGRPAGTHFHDLVILLGRYWISHGGLTEARIWVDRAMDRDDPVDDLTNLRLINLSSWIASFQGEHDRAIEEGRTALRIADEMGDVREQLNVLNAHGGAALHRGDIPAAIHIWEGAVARAEAAGDNIRTTGVVHNLALGYLYSGDVRKARETHAKETVLAGEAGDHEISVLSLLLGVELDIAESQLDQAYRSLKHVFDIVDRDANESLAIDVMWVAGALAVEMNAPAVGAQIIGAARALRSQMGFAAPISDEAVDRERLGKMRDALGSEVLDQLIADGAGLTFDEVVELTKSLRPDVQATIEQDRHGLTQREREVLLLLGEGGTNREIAGQLYISPRTVQSHVANILAKLGVPSRAAAASWAAREGLE